MGRRFLIYWFLSLTGVSFFSCGLAAPYLDVWRGNSAFDNGNYQGANLFYGRGLGYKGYEEWISYNLANSYYALGEEEAAREEWAKAEDTRNKALLFKVYLNKGIFFFHKGRFAAAALSFKEALRINPQSRAAKIDLELSITKAENSRQDAARQAQIVPGESFPQEDKQGGTEQILRYLKAQEAIRPPSLGEKSNKENDW